MFISAG